MYDKLWLIPFFPLVGCVINGLLGKKIKNEKIIGGIGTLAMVCSFLVACKYFFQLFVITSYSIHYTKLYDKRFFRHSGGMQVQDHTVEYGQFALPVGGGR